MRIVRPYGESRTGFEKGKLQRDLVARDQERSRHDIEAFSQSHPELVIAQWISVIDKIVTKPSGTNGATDTQRALRTRLGDACWVEMTNHERLQAPASDMERLGILWRFKIHPYGDAPYKQRKNKQGDILPEPDPRGRWFGRFAGEVDTEKVDAAHVAMAIDRHLYVSAKRIHAGVADREAGLIGSRARSIAGNTVALVEDRSQKNRIDLPTAWTEAEEREYMRRGDVAAEIHSDALAHEQDAKYPYRLSSAAKLLEAHWWRLFGKGATRFSDIPEEKHRLLALHLAVKEAYRTKLKRRKAPVSSKKATRPAPKLSPASQILPRHGRALLELVGNIQRNREISDLIRRGKLIHYSAADLQRGRENTAAPLFHWVNDLSTSRYRTSDGQAAIKRAEAFVRIWRHTIAMSALTARDWASMKAGDIEDVYANKRKPEDAIAPDNFDLVLHDRKADVIFGNRAALFAADETAKKGLLASLIRVGIALRNSSFHFKGRGGFLAALEGIAAPGITDPVTLTSARQLWEQDASDQGARLRATLVGAHASMYFDTSQLTQVLGHLEGAIGGSDLPLPRFRRMLLRAENAWKGKEKLNLPNTANRKELELQPALLCRYVVLKELYEKPFRVWMAARNEDEITGWIQKSLSRSTAAAKDLNARDEDEKKAIIEARAGGLLKGRTWDLRGFLMELSRATASEMQVQRGYGHDGEAAREQAGFIDDVLCDVTALAFETWLKSEELTWICAMDPGAPLPAQPICDIDRIASASKVVMPDDWAVVLYLFLHLIPVGEVGRLLHQLAKWEVTAALDDELTSEEEARLAALNRTLVLYLDMHDAKFEGGAALVGIDEFRELFASQAGFSRIFPPQSEVDRERRVPKRGLREIMRFGHRGLLQTIAGTDKITDAEVDRYLEAESGEGPNSLAAIQERRESAHEKWVKSNEKRAQFTSGDLRTYVEALRDLTLHRHLSGGVTLTDMVELHRVLMAVLGRVVDYSGLFERDLYFVTLGLLHRKGLKPDKVFSGQPPDDKGEGGQGGQELLAQGRIFPALQRGLCADAAGNTASDAIDLKTELQRLFGDPAGRTLFGGKGTLQQLRNDFGHFNWLHAGSGALNVTAILNDTRVLMSYDRKLANAVSKSIKELLAREGVDVTWEMPNHVLVKASVGTRHAAHLGRKTVFDRVKKRRLPILEGLKSRAFLNSLSEMLHGETRNDFHDVTSWDLEAMDWRGKNRKNAPQGHKPHPGKGKKR